MSEHAPDPALVQELAARLDGDGGDRMARIATRVRTAVRALAALVVLAGVAGLALGLAAWHDRLLGVVLVIVLCAPAVVAPLYLAVRTGPLADAATHPRELADQARDLLGRTRGSPELRDLAGRLRAFPTGGAARRRGRGRIRDVLGLARAASSVVGQAQPDPHRHRLLLALSPERLRATWLATTVSLWAGPLAVLVAMVSAIALVLRRL